MARHRRRGRSRHTPARGFSGLQTIVGRCWGDARAGRRVEEDRDVASAAHFSLYLLWEKQPAWITFSILEQLEAPAVA